MEAPGTDLFTARATLPGPIPAWDGPPPDKVVMIRARIGGDDGPVKTFKGRFAFALAHLIQAGRQGLTVIERPAPRWSHYVMMLKRDGVGIVTETERHGGDFAGKHGRYRLTIPVHVLETKASEAA